tara:strand:- start:1699 stop:2106 length:408 start_codon:yes stop_codon:yes gene_type:complete
MPPLYTFEKTTDDIRVLVTPVFMDEDSKPEDLFYLWAYQVRIENLSPSSITILDRQWKVIDAHGVTQNISGPGVFKDRPSLKPGDAFEYTNTIPLGTTSGFMTGKYALEKAKGTFVDIDIPTFSLDSPYESHLLN